MTDTQVTWLTQEALRPAEGRARPADRQPPGHRRRDQRPPRRGRPARERRLPRRPRGAGPAGSPHPPAAGTAEQRQGRRGAQAVRRRTARLGGQGLLRRRQERHRDVPDRHPPGGRQRRQARGVLAEAHRWAAPCSTPRSARRRTYTVPNGNTVKVTLRQRGALPLLTRRPGRGATVRPHGADRRGPVPAAAGQCVRAARAGRHRVAAGAGGRGCCSIWPTPAGSGPSVDGEPVEPGRLVALAGRGPCDPVAEPAFALLQRSR